MEERAHSLIIGPSVDRSFDKYPVQTASSIKSFTVGSVTLEMEESKANEVIAALNSILVEAQIAKSTQEANEAWNAVQKNKQDFIKERDEVVSTVRNSVFSDRRLQEGTCSDCEDLKQRLRRLTS